eukprot:GHVU01108827.1.p1 GENE.GHVU01108827.1~~GHVU01108827.1.p1  ORF type:complete len:199 (-),score=28.44 GHVU01108827.1:151-747(-)
MLQHREQRQQQRGQPHRSSVVGPRNGETGDAPNSGCAQTNYNEENGWFFSGPRRRRHARRMGSVFVVCCIVFLSALWSMGFSFRRPDHVSDASSSPPLHYNNDNDNGGGLHSEADSARVRNTGTSLAESGGFFSVPDSAWRSFKEIALNELQRTPEEWEAFERLHTRSFGEAVMQEFYQDFWEPSVACMHEDRIGALV